MMARDQGCLFNGNIDFKGFGFLHLMSTNRNHLPCHMYEEMEVSLNKGVLWDCLPFCCKSVLQQSCVAMS